ncbi:MAG: hypothetical protein CBC03_14460 [Pseudoalteromonas sp. TMED43]|nr:MAG: hypothetical protein CBC03_14460 [Pseudoalteromonas sp. TMED43]|tara:strand:+ start:3173 stop:3556 length:384 start_codon:yes stop_codon:yes gene_type:complete
MVDKRRVLAEFRYYDEPTLDSQLPITLSNGFVVVAINGACPLCKKEIAQYKIKGTVTLPLPTVLTFDANAVCDECKCIFPLYGRIRAKNKTAQIERLENGRWVFYSHNALVDKFKLSLNWLTRFFKD